MKEIGQISRTKSLYRTILKKTGISILMSKNEFFKINMNNIKKTLERNQKSDNLETLCFIKYSSFVTRQ